MKKVKIEQLWCPNAIYIYIYIYTAQTPAQTKKQEYIKEDKGRRPRRRPPGKGTEMLIKTGGADPGADLQKQKDEIR